MTWTRGAAYGLTIIYSLGWVLIAPHRSVAQSCPGEQCPGDANCDGQVTIDEILTVVDEALNGCPMAISADEACTNVANAQCTKLDACVVNGTTSRYGGTSVCQARQKEVCLRRLSATGTGNSASAVEQCAQQLATASCSDFDLSDVPDCQPKIGSLADGQPCAFPGQCQSANCAIVTGTNCGTCEPPNLAGNSCATTSCSTGFVCVKETQPQQCQPPGTTDSVCDAGHPCGAGFSCVTPSGMPTGICQAAGSTPGAQCDPQRHSAPACDPDLGLYCNGTSKTCVALTYTVADGQCGFVNPVVAACTNASTCFGAQGQTPGLCVANAGDGMPCDTQAGPSCLPPARCVTGGSAVTSGTCQQPDAAACS